MNKMMKKLGYLTVVLLVLASCSDDQAGQPNLGEVGFPNDWVFTKDVSGIEQDPSVAEYTYIYTNKSAMFRDEILKSYPLRDLVDEEYCLFYVSETTSSSGKRCYTIQLKDDKSRFLGASESSNKEEIHLIITKGVEVVPVGSPSYFAPPDYDNEGSDSWKFYFHRMDDKDGVKTYAIENVALPGWYISDSPPGFNYAANVVTLQLEQGPESAPKWQCRSVN